MKKDVVRLQDVPLENQDLTGKTVVFSGGTDGMGRVAVEKLAKMGAAIVVLGRNEGKSKAVVDAINQATEPGRARYVRCDLASGEEVYRQRIPHGGRGFSASPVAADGKLYLASEDGQVFMVGAGQEYRLLAENSVGEPVMATPAIAGKTLYVRTQQHLVAIGK